MQISEPIKAVPVDAIMIMKIPDLADGLQNLIHNNLLWRQIATMPEMEKTNKQLLFLDSILTFKDLPQEMFHKKKLLLSMHCLGKKNVEFVFYIAHSPEFTKNSIHSYIKKHITGKDRISERIYEGTTIYDISIRRNNSSPIDFSYTFQKGIFVFSFSSILLEDAIRQLKDNYSLIKDNDFQTVAASAGKNVDANLFINFSTLPNFLSVILNEKYHHNSQILANYTRWAELDIKIKNDIILLNGFSFANDSSYFFLNNFNDQEPQKLELEKILPANTYLFLALEIDKPNLYYNNYITHLKHNRKYQSYISKINKINSYFNSNIPNTFLSFIDNEIAVAYLNQTENIFDNAFIIAKTKSISLAKDNLLLVLNKYGQKNNIKINDLKTIYKVDNEISYEIYKMPIKGMFNKIFGGIFNTGNADYFTFIDNYIVFGNSIKSLSDFIYANIHNKTLQNDLYYTSIKENISSKSNVCFYMNYAKNQEFLINYLNKKGEVILHNNSNALKYLQTIVFQLNTNGDMIYNNLFIKHSSEFSENSKTVWETLIDTICDFKPKFVINHNNHKKEILIQDVKNNIYLINMIGRILWKVPIKEKIISDIYQIDYYNNGKLQMLFSTKNYIYLIDRNGNFVENYPIQLRSPSTNAMSLFDYDGNKDYRIFIACENKRIYPYNIEGKVIKGWEFNQTETHVGNRIQHFRMDQKDYLVFSDQYKTYILNRKGQERVRLNEHFIKSENNNFIIDIKDGDSRLLTTNNKGEIIQIYFDGNIKKIEIKNFPSNHYFSYIDINSDGLKDYIFTVNNRLEVFNQKKELLFTFELNNRINKKPIFYQFSKNERYLGIVDQFENKIYLINGNGNLYKGFPLNGNTQFSIGMLSDTYSKFNLIVGSNDNFLYNYAIK